MDDILGCILFLMYVEYLEVLRHQVLHMLEEIAT
jgi:hypothetical protein